MILLNKKKISIIFLYYVVISLLLLSVSDLKSFRYNSDHDTSPKAAQGLSDIEFVSVPPSMDYYDWDYINGIYFSFSVQIEDASGGDINADDEVMFWIAPESDKYDTQIMENIQPGSYIHSNVNTWFTPGSYGGDTQIFYSGNGYWCFHVDASIMDDYLNTLIAIDCAAHDTAADDWEELSWESDYGYVRVIQYSVILNEPNPGQYINSSIFDVDWDHERHQEYFNDLEYFEVWLDSGTKYHTTETYYEFSDVSDGPHVAHVVGKTINDDYGIEKTVSFYYDETPPDAPNLSSPSDGSYINDNSPYLMWSIVSGADTYELSVDDNLAFTSPMNHETSNTYYTLSTLSDDMYYWKVRAKDVATNIGPFSETWSFTIDTTSPTITINVPNGNYYDSAPLINVDFSDSVGLDDGYYKVDSYTPSGLDTTGWISIFTSSVGTAYTSDFTMDNSVWDGLSEGSHTIYFKTWDDCGNINDGSTPSWQFYKDTTNPSIVINSPNGEYHASAPIMDVEFSDALGLDDAYYKIDSYSPTGLDTTGWTAIFTDHSGTSYSVDFAMDSSVWDGLGEGSHTVYFKVWDDSGNIKDGSTPSLQFYKDTGAPSILINSQNGVYYASTPLIDVDFLDDCGLDDAYYKVDSYTPTGLDTTGWISIFSNQAGTSYFTDFTMDSSVWDGLGEGSHTVYFKAWDDAGNINDGDTPSWQFYKDTETPSILINSPNGDYYASTPLMDVDFSDSLGLTDAYYKVDSYTPDGLDTTGWISIFTSFAGTAYTSDFAIDNSVWDGLGEGAHNVYFKVWDDATNINDGPSPSWYFYKDTGGPSIMIHSPNGEFYSSAPIMDVDFSDAVGLDDAYYKVDSYTPNGLDTTGWISIFTDDTGTSYSSDFSMDNSVWDGLSEGSHIVYFKAWDDTAQITDGETHSWQFYKDTGTPTISINTLNGDYYSSTPTLDVDFSDTIGLDDAYYKVDSYSPTGLDTTGWISIFTSFAGTDYTSDFSMDNSVWDGLSEGSHIVYFKIWDDCGNINDGSTPSWQFYKDTGTPTITVNTLNGKSFSLPPTMDVDFSDTIGLDNAYYKIDSYSPTGIDTTGWISIFTDHSGTSYSTDFVMDNSIWNGLSEGSHTVYFKVWDDSGNVNDGTSPSWQFYKDTGAPIIVINTPNGEYYVSAPMMDIDFSDNGGLDDAYYKIDSYTPTGLDTTGWISIFTDDLGTSYSTDFAMDNAVWDGLGEGSHTIYFKLWDDAGNVNDGSSPSWQFYKDTGAPTITVNSLDGDYYSSAPLIDVDFLDNGDLDEAYYKIDSYAPNGLDTMGWIAIFTGHSGTSFSTDFSMDNSVWDGLGEGSHTVYFKAWDDSGNINDGDTPTWQFYKDAGVPLITINNPNNEYYASIPMMDVDFSDNGGLDDAYYKVDSFTPNGLDTTGWISIFTSFAGTDYTSNFSMDSSLWDGLNEGSHTVYFKVWDDTGQINDGNSPTWQFYKDTEAPLITIHSTDGDYHGSVPMMDIDFFDVLGLDNAYYKLDSYTPANFDTIGWTPIFIDHEGTSYSTDFIMDSSIWNGLSSGSHIVYFKAWDDAGNINDGNIPMWQFYKDITVPSITINNADGNYYSSVPLMNIDFLDNYGLENAYYKMDSYTPTGFDTTGWNSVFLNQPGTSYTTDFSMDNSVWDGLSDGSHVVYFKVWDDAGNVNDGSSPSWQFYKDVGVPLITINTPNDEYYTSIPMMDVDFTDTNGLDDAYYKVDSYSPTGLTTTGWISIFTSLTGASYTSDFSMDNSVWDGLSEGSHIVYFKAWDDFNNINDGSTPSWQFYKDTNKPVITINTQNKSYYSSIPLINIDFSDTYELSDAYYKVDSYSPTGLATTGWIPIFTSLTGGSYTSDFSLDNSVWDGLDEGSHVVYFKVWDDAGNINDGDTPSWQFYKDVGLPSITVNSPSGEHYNSAPLLDVDFFDNYNLSAAYYKIDSFTPTGTTTTDWQVIFMDSCDTSYLLNFTIEPDKWDILSDGSHVIYFKVWDHAGNINDGETPTWQFYKDTSGPLISLNSPSDGGVYQSDTEIDLSFVDDSSLSTILYRWDGAVTYNAYNDSQLIRLIIGDGQHNLEIWANDSLGNINSDIFSFITDDTPPTAIFHGISSSSVFAGLETFEVIPNDLNGIKTVSLYLNDIFLEEKTNEFAFNFNSKDYSDGNYTIKFLVMDNAENVYEKTFSIRIKNVDFPVIPGYDIGIVIMNIVCILSLVSILMKKKLNLN